jgi:hypothetical protein
MHSGYWIQNIFVVNESDKKYGITINTVGFQSIVLLAVILLYNSQYINILIQAWGEILLWVLMSVPGLILDGLGR